VVLSIIAEELAGETAQPLASISSVQVCVCVCVCVFMYIRSVTIDPVQFAYGLGGHLVSLTLGCTNAIISPFCHVIPLADHQH
jgi:hypothetical protein